MCFTRSAFFRRIMTGSALLTAAWWFHSQWIAPLQRREVEARQSLAEMRQRLQEARWELRAINELGQKAAHARATLTTMQSESPSEPAVVWFPSRLRQSLGGFGIATAAIRLNTDVPEPGLAGFKRTYWNVDLPLQEGMRSMTGVLRALVEIEQRKSFVKILDFSFHSDAAAPHGPVGVFNVEALVRE